DGCGAETCQHAAASQLDFAHVVPIEPSMPSTMMGQHRNLRPVVVDSPPLDGALRETDVDDHVELARRDAEMNPFAKAAVAARKHRPGPAYEIARELAGVHRNRSPQEWKAGFAAD